MLLHIKKRPHGAAIFAIMYLQNWVMLYIFFGQKNVGIHLFQHHYLPIGPMDESFLWTSVKTTWWSSTHATFWCQKLRQVSRMTCNGLKGLQGLQWVIGKMKGKWLSVVVNGRSDIFGAFGVFIFPIEERTKERPRVSQLHIRMGKWKSDWKIHSRCSRWREHLPRTPHEWKLHEYYLIGKGSRIGT